MARTRCFQYLNFPHILHFCSMRVRLSGCRSHLEVGPCCGPLLFRPELEWDIVMSQDVLSSVWAIAESLAFELGLDLVDVEQGGGRKRQVLRLFVDKPDGVGLADCEQAPSSPPWMTSRLATAVFDRDRWLFMIWLEEGEADR